MNTELSGAVEAIAVDPLPQNPVAAAAPAYRLVSRFTKPTDTVIDVAGVEIGGAGFVVMAGPCAVEDLDQLLSTAQIVKQGGGAILRGGAFKPRTSPYSFQGLAEEGLRILKKVGSALGMPVVTEVMDPQHVALVEEHADILQVGARNVQNFCLLQKVGAARKPVLLKRGFMTTVEEFLLSAEYVLAAGNDRVILCERGIRTFETATRNTLDLSVVPVLKERTHLPVVVDPSHAVGNWRYVPPLAKGALAVGADGLLVEVHVCPERALCDGTQSLRPDHYLQLMEELHAMAGLLRRPCK
jgi:3-deoxy-7-phosphoheptulonate synthase